MLGRKEHIPKHKRRTVTGRWVSIPAFERRPKPKKVKWIKPMKKKYEVTYYQDDQGRIVSRRKYRGINR